MRTFEVYRPCAPSTHTDAMKNPHDMVQFQGVVFDDGTVAVRWMTRGKSTSVWASFDDMYAIHGHPEYGTYVVWDNGAVTTHALDLLRYGT